MQILEMVAVFSKKIFIPCFSVAAENKKAGSLSVSGLIGGW